MERQVQLFQWLSCCLIKEKVVDALGLEPRTR